MRNISLFSTRFTHFVFTTFIVLGFSIGNLSAAIVTWDGGGDDTNWTDPLNWDTNALPTASDDVDLNGATVILTANTQVQRVYAGGSSHLTINNGVTLIITGFAGDDDGLEIQGSATCINNGTIAISNITGGVSADGLYNKGTFTNNGSITIDDTGDHGIYAQDGTFTNSSGASIDITNVTDDHIIVDDNSGAPATFNNNGTITITMVTGDDGIYVNDGASFNNSSIINLSAGVGATTDESIYSEDFGAFNNLSGGMITISSGTDYGLQTKNNGVMTNAGTITIEQMPDHQIWMDGPGAFSNSGTINLNNSISGKNALYVTDECVFTNETTGQVNITNPTNYGIQIDANGSTAEVINNGTMTIMGGSNDGLRIQEVGKFTNNASGNLNIVNAGDAGIQIDDNTPASTFNNSGIVNITNAADDGLELFGTFNNLMGGIFQALDCVDDGIRMRNTGVFNNDGLIAIHGSGSEDIETDADTGTTFSNTSNATFAPGTSPGLMEIKDDFDMGAATVIFEITGTTAITEYDQIQNFTNVNPMNLTNATIHLDWGAYIPNVGNTFKVMDGSGKITGPFAAITSSNPNIIVTADYTGDTNAEVEIEVTSVAITCPVTTTLASSNITTTTADLNWAAVSEATSYNWVVVAAGEGAGGTAVASGTTATTMAAATGLSDFTSYDLHVQTDCGGGDLSPFSPAHNFTTVSSDALTSDPLGTGTSSSATRGPFQRSDSNSGSVHSRANMVYTQDEILATLGINSGSTITQVNWDLGSTNQITASGDATLNIYMKNSSVTEATADTWTNLITGTNLVGTYTFNTTNNFPGVEGFFAFPLNDNFVYTGESIEIAVEWDCSNLVPADPMQPNLLFSGNGSLNWNWDNTTHNSLTYRAGSSPPTDITNLKAERVNTQFVYVLPPCVPPSNLNASNLGTSTADLSWDAVTGAISYNWVVVAAGDGAAGTAVASGMAIGMTMATATGLSANTSYDLHVQTDCGGGDISDFSLAYNFITACPIPTGLASSNITSTTADFNWDAVTGATMYNWVVVAAGEGAAGTAVASGTTASTMASAAGLSSSTSYDLHVQADCNDNLGDFSEAHSFITAVSTCPTPMNLASANITQTTADLTWDASAGASSYTWTVVAAGDCLDGTVVASGTTASTMVTATDLIGNTSYDLKVQADCDANGLSDLSAIHNFTTVGVSAPMLLSADGPGGTYALMTAALGPGADPLEPPDCNHGDFMATPTNNVGEHIDEVFDADLGKDVFRFHLHVTPDNDRCINFDRQRNEIKTYNESPDNLLGVLGETVEYKWKFKLPEGFQSSARFTHIHQLKSVGASNAEDDQPQITFTTRKGTNGNPDQLELRYAETLTQITWAQTDLTPFKGTWVEATETVTYGDWGEGVYDLVIKNVATCETMFSYSNNSTRMWKTDAAFVRPKWGIYRSLEDAADLRDEEVLFDDFSIKELSNTPDCAGPTTFLNASNVSFFTADLSWGGVPGASAYTWKVVAAGAGSGAPAVAEGTTVNTTVSVSGLMDNTSYDLYVDADCGSGNTTGFSVAYNFMTEEDTGEIVTDPLGTETSSSSSRGPIHQAGTGASTRYSRFFHVFTEDELADVGLTANSSITELQWYITTSDVITGAGDAPCKIYIKNSSATVAVEGSWAAFTMGSTLALDKVFNESDNFLGTAGWMPFSFDTPFEYTGGGLEVGVEFNWASVAFTNNGTVKWRYSNYVDDVVVRSLATAADGDYKDNLTLSTTGKQRSNMQIVHIPAPVTCPAPENLNATNITTSSADVSWGVVDGASAYTWKVVELGAGAEATALDEGTIAGTTAAASNLSDLTAYDLHVQADCGGGDLSTFSPAYTFVTASSTPPSMLTFGTGTDVNSSIGPVHQGGISASTRYSRFNQVFTQEELVAAGLTADSKITELQWYLASTNVITIGEAPFKLFIKNSDVTEATPMSWSDLTLGLDPVVDIVFDASTNLQANGNFPGVEGWLPFTFDVPFVYTGGALEVLVEWDWASAAFTNDGALDWRYSITPVNTVVRKLGSGSHTSSNLSLSTSANSPPTYRANMQIVYVDPTPLPVEMTYFVGNQTKEGNLLEWETATEQHNQGFEIQKSENGRDWEAIGFVESKGTTTTGSKYDFLDTKPLAVNYYRLKQLNTNGSFEYSKTVLISSTMGEGATIHVYPNPVANELTIEGFEGLVTVYNLLGQPLKVFKVTNSKETIALGELKTGEYLLEMTGIDGSKTIEKITKIEK